VPCGQTSLETFVLSFRRLSSRERGFTYVKITFTVVVALFFSSSIGPDSKKNIFISACSPFHPFYLSSLHLHSVGNARYVVEHAKVLGSAARRRSVAEDICATPPGLPPWQRQDLINHDPMDFCF
jgi:hypothetical protein